MNYSRAKSFGVLHFRNASYPNNNCALGYGQRPTYCVVVYVWHSDVLLTPVTVRCPAVQYSSLSARQCLIVGAKHLEHDTTGDWTCVCFGLCTPPFSFRNLTRKPKMMLYLHRNLLTRLSYSFKIHRSLNWVFDDCNFIQMVFFIYFKNSLDTSFF